MDKLLTERFFYALQIGNSRNAFRLLWWLIPILMC